jgi:hypothetical protein
MKNNNRLNIFLLLFILSAFKSYSCTCISIRKSNVKDAIKSNDYIFVGKVKKIDIVKIENLDLFKVLFEVESRFKGKVKKFITIYTNSEEDMCGFPFKLHHKYIVYASLYKHKYITKSKRKKNIIVTDVCSRTKLYDKDEILKLKKHKKEKPVKRKGCNNKKAILNDD